MVAWCHLGHLIPPPCHLITICRLSLAGISGTHCRWERSGVTINIQCLLLHQTTLAGLTWLLPPPPRGSASSSPLYLPRQPFSTREGLWCLLRSAQQPGLTLQSNSDSRMVALTKCVLPGESRGPSEQLLRQLPELFSAKPIVWGTSCQLEGRGGTSQQLANLETEKKVQD